MREQQEDILQQKSHRRKFWMHATRDPQCSEMFVSSINHVMHVNALEGWLHKIWLN